MDCWKVFQSVYAYRSEWVDRGPEKPARDYKENPHEEDHFRRSCPCYRRR